MKDELVIQGIPIKEGNVLAGGSKVLCKLLANISHHDSIGKGVSWDRNTTCRMVWFSS